MEKVPHPKVPRSRLEKVTKQSGKLKDTVLYTFVAAGGMIVALAWRDAAQCCFEKYCDKHLAKNKSRSLFIYAISTTIILIIGLYILSRFTRKNNI
jgi:di/tricarboxylate transporter